MLHRHPLLSLVTAAYLGFVGWLTLTPSPASLPESTLFLRILARVQRHDGFSWLTFDRAEFLANIALFAPVGLFLLLLVGTRWWWVAGLAGLGLSAAIETAQRTIPGRVPDERDLVANTAGALLGVLVGLVLTYPATRRGNSTRRSAVPR